jgi:hypothetical protein
MMCYIGVGRLTAVYRPGAARGSGRQVIIKRSCDETYIAQIPCILPGIPVLRCCGAAVLRCPGGLVFCEENEMNPAVGGKRDSVGIRKPLNLR